MDSDDMLSGCKKAFYVMKLFHNVEVAYTGIFMQDTPRRLAAAVFAAGALRARYIVTRVL